jgi:hypothetical protein
LLLIVKEKKEERTIHPERGYRRMHLTILPGWDAARLYLEQDCARVKNMEVFHGSRYIEPTPEWKIERCRYPHINVRPD